MILNIPAGNPVEPAQPPANLLTQLDALSTKLRQSDISPAIVTLVRLLDTDSYFKGYLTRFAPRPISAITARTTPALPDSSETADDDLFLNIMLGDLRAYMAVLGDRSPNATAIRADTSDEDDSAPTDLAKRLLQVISSIIPGEQILQSILRIFALRGACLVEVDLVKVGERTATRTEIIQVPTPMGTCPQCQVPFPVEQTPTCPSCGGPPSQISVTPVPTPTSVQYQVPLYQLQINPRSQESAFTDTTIDVDKWGTDCCWLMHEEDVFSGQLYRRYPNLRQTYPQADSLPMGSAGTATSNTYHRYVRLRMNVTSQAAWDAMTLKATSTRVFISPAAMELISDPLVREYCLTNYPGGAKICYVGMKSHSIEPYNLHDHWVAETPDVDRTLGAAPYFHSYLSGQDLINTSATILAKAAARSVPTTLINSAGLTEDIIRKIESNVGSYVPMTVKAGQLSDQIHQTETIRFPSAHIQFLGFMLELLRDISGIKPPIWGGGDSRTAEEAKIKSRQALQRLNPSWRRATVLFSKVFTLAIRLIAREVKSNPDLELVRDANATNGTNVPWAAGCENESFVVQCDDTFPQSAAALRDWYKDLIERMGANPMLAQIFELSNPDNLKQFQEILGVSGMKSKALDQRAKIRQMLTGIMESPQEMLSQMPIAGGMDLSFWSTVMDPKLVLEVTQDFLSTIDSTRIRPLSPQAQAFELWLQIWSEKASPPPPLNEGEPSPDQESDSGTPPVS